MAFSFWTWNPKAILRPIHIGPFERQMLGRATKSLKSAQCNN
jgi:hypothetical protein